MTFLPDDAMNDELLVKYLLNEATEEEAASVRSWIGAKPENARYYRDFKTIWEESRKLAAKSDVDVDAAWTRFQSLVAADKKSRRIVFQPKQLFRAAAGLALLITGSLLFFYLNRQPQMIVRNSGKATLTDTLPDGSIVTLNKNSELRYPGKFRGETRAVVLNGEAFFEVTPDKSHPFIITANEASVKVVGTSFNVKSSPSTTEVIVATGVVEVSRREKAVRLLPNEATTVYKGKADFNKRKTDDELYNYYHTKEFVCNNTPLARMAEVLSEAYNVRIEIPEPALRNVPMTVTFQNESLPEVLRVICETLNIQAVQQSDRIIFKSR